MGYGTLVYPSIRWYISISTVSFKMLGHFHSSLFTDMDLAAILTLAPQKIELVITSPTMFNLFLTNNQLPKNDAYLMYIFFLFILFLLIHIAYQQFIDKKLIISKADWTKFWHGEYVYQIWKGSQKECRHESINSTSSYPTRSVTIPGGLKGWEQKVSAEYQSVFREPLMDCAQNQTKRGGGAD